MSTATEAADELPDDAAEPDVRDWEGDRRPPKDMRSRQERIDDEYERARRNNWPGSEWL